MRSGLMFIVTGFALCLAMAPALRAAEGGVSFNRDIRPILSDKCFKCHGPDEGSREAGLRLDERAAATGDLGGYAAIVPGDISKSELVRRITTSDPGDRMPPADSQLALTDHEIDLLKRWIERGAEYEAHWSFIPPQRPALPGTVPAVSGLSPPGTRIGETGVNPHKTGTDPWARNAIDRFILARMEREGLSPQPEADRRRLIRRVTLDLTGLPPTPEEVEAALGDVSPDWYEKVVDRLLDSPRYGERMAVPWLDAARYADTHGYLFDTERYQWRWRDWAIDAYNRNLSFDKFTTEQLAGDLLENPTDEQLLATGFNRNHAINNEAGAIAAEYFVENIFDRVETVGTIWMGLTLQCARCHDHKYDPIAQREYYQLYAFFNNVPEQGLDGFNKNADPVMRAPTPDQALELTALERKIAEAEAAMAPYVEKIDAEQTQWEEGFSEPFKPLEDGLAGLWAFEKSYKDEVSGADGERKEGFPFFGDGMFGKAVKLSGLDWVDAGQAGAFDSKEPFSVSAWVYPETQEGRRAIFSKMASATESYRGWALQLVEGSPSFFMVNRFPDNSITVQTGVRLETHKWHHVLATYDGSGKAEGVKLYVDGKEQKIALKVSTLAGSVTVEEPLEIGRGQPGAFFKGMIDDARLYARVVTPEELERIPGLSIQSLVSVPKDERGEEHKKRVRGYYLLNHAPQEWREPYRKLAAMRDEYKAIDREMPTAMIMREMPKPRDAFILDRGAYDKPGEKVSIGTPAALPAFPEGLRRDRLGLAQWLLSPEHPLTARVTVNRYWQLHFGNGLVSTAEDFGLQGEWPSHPELLDWLATEFIRTGWDVKRMHRLIVTSAAYRQSSRVTPDLLERDPDNRLIARGPKLRLEGEFIRDAALAMSGLLVGEIGGPSVKPYQPAELWREVAFDTSGSKLTGQIYVQDTGEKLFRRSLYTFWKRTLPPPTLLTFDAPERERCTIKREPSNTPLQALIVMNDPTFVEASRKLAERVMRETGADADDRIARLYEIVLARRPTSQEAEPLTAFYAEQVSRFSRQPSAAEGLLGVGESPRDSSLDPVHLAATATVANVVLNLDEALTKN